MDAIRIYTGEDGQSHFETVQLEMKELKAGKWGTDLISNEGVEFEETASGGTFEWHNAPRRQYVITLSGQLEFECRGGEKQIIKPGDILLAEDARGGGHRWKLINDQPWRRLYIHLEA